jgi:transmembrane sensor
MRALTDEHDLQAFRHPDPVIDEALEWVLKRQAGEVDQDTLDVWLAEGSGRREALSRVLALYECPALTVATAQTAAAAQRSPESKSRMPLIARRFGPVPLALAASLAAAMVVPLIGSDWLMRLRADYRTGAGEITVIDLPDGSRMQMNSQTAVMLDFEHGRRAVRLLEGEAFFEVIHDATRPFTVTGGYGTVQVMGTAFDVARDGDADVVHLQSGRVELTRQGESTAPVAMTPGETASVDHAGIAFLPQDSSDSRLAWRDGWIELSAVPLRKALEEIGRHTELHVVTLPRAVLDTPVSGSFRIGEAEAAIDSVATAAGARIERLPGRILFIH